jgi:nitroimidazol reductase NimA-like FMN-containing flavoprotein (pyridoxamine 5'-phosphate oxidase superfamily)
VTNQRDQIKMSDAEVGAFINAERDLQVATINPTGTPHLSTNWYVVLDEKIHFTTHQKSQKAVNLLRDPRITALLSSGDHASNIKGVVLYGEAEILEGDSTIEERFEIMWSIVLRNQPPPPDRDLESAQNRIRNSVRHRISVAIVPYEIASWDHTKLDGYGS